MPSRAILQGPCTYCGAPVARRPSDAARVKHLFCNQTCVAAWRRDGNHYRRGQASGATRICVTCGTTFYLFPSQLLNPHRTGQYCSNSCQGPQIGRLKRGSTLSAEARAKISAARSGKPVPARQKPPRVRTCASCGKEFALPKSHNHTAQTRRFCDRACRFAHMRAHPDLNGRWRGGREPYYGPNWKQQASAARERDHHTCQDCGRRQKRPLLHVHHLVPRRSFARNFEAANRLDNLLTLCAPCHARREGAFTSR